MGLVDVRRFAVTTKSSGPEKLEVDRIELADEGEWDVQLARMVEVNALAVPAKRVFAYPVMRHELRLLLSFVSDHASGGISLRHQEFKASASHIKRFVSESFGLGMLSAAAEQHYGWRLNSADLAHFDVLPLSLAESYPKTGTRPDLLFSFRSDGQEDHLAGEARGRSGRRPKGGQPGNDQRKRLDQLVAWSGRNDFHPVTMTWAYGAGNRVHIDMFDVDIPGDQAEKKSYDEAEFGASPQLSLQTMQMVEQQAQGRAEEIIDRLYTTARESTPQVQRRVFQRDVQGDWVTADLVARSDLRLFFGILDRPIDAERSDWLRRGRRMGLVNRPQDRIEITAAGRIIVVIARGGAEPPTWTEVANLVE